MRNSNGNRSVFERKTAVWMAALMLFLAMAGALAYPHTVLASKTIDDNKRGQKLDSVTDEEEMKTNEGTIDSVSGLVKNNYGNIGDVKNIGSVDVNENA